MVAAGPNPRLRGVCVDVLDEKVEFQRLQDRVRSPSYGNHFEASKGLHVSARYVTILRRPRGYFSGDPRHTLKNQNSPNRLEERSCRHMQTGPTATA